MIANRQWVETVAKRLCEDVARAVRNADDTAYAKAVAAVADALDAGQLDAIAQASEAVLALKSNRT